jgi:hypothetical protein
MCKVFDNLAIGNWQLAISQTKVKKRQEKELRQDSHKAVEWQFSFCFQQNVLPPGGVFG